MDETLRHFSRERCLTFSKWDPSLCPVFSFLFGTFLPCFLDNFSNYSPLLSLSPGSSPVLRLNPPGSSPDPSRRDRFRRSSTAGRGDEDDEATNSWSLEELDGEEPILSSNSVLEWGLPVLNQWLLDFRPSSNLTEKLYLLPICFSETLIDCTLQENIFKAVAFSASTHESILLSLELLYSTQGCKEEFHQLKKGKAVALEHRPAPRKARIRVAEPDLASVKEQHSFEDYW